FPQMEGVDFTIRRDIPGMGDSRSDLGAMEPADDQPLEKRADHPQFRLARRLVQIQSRGFGAVGYDQRSGAVPRAAIARLEEQEKKNQIYAGEKGHFAYLFMLVWRTFRTVKRPPATLVLISNSKSKEW